MAPLYNPAVEGPEEARSCIDQFEFPNIPCEYPVVWVRAVEAALLCRAVGKRLCDAHEDWCRWRAPFWHGSRVMDPKSHHNYHLSFRCCKTLTK